MLKNCMPEIAKPDDPTHTVLVMQGQLGTLSKMLIQNQRSMTPWSYRAEAEEKLANLIVQCELLAEQMEWPLDELVMDGHKRFHERMNKLKDGIL